MILGYREAVAKKKDPPANSNSIVCHIETRLDDSLCGGQAAAGLDVLARGPLERKTRAKDGVPPDLVKAHNRRPQDLVRRTHPVRGQRRGLVLGV